MRVLEPIFDAIKFNVSTFNVFLRYIKIILPLMILFSYADYIANGIDAPWIKYITVVLHSYITACFAYSWHRFILIRDDVGFVNPFRFDFGPEKKRFFKVFIFIYLGMFVFSLGIEKLTPFGQANNYTVLFLMISIFIAGLIYGWLCILRASFMLPASAIGDDISYKDAKEISRGLKFYLLSAFILMALLTSFIFILYSLFIKEMTGINILPVIFDLGPADIQAFLLHIPMIFIELIASAFGVTVLSKLYIRGAR